MNNLKNIFQKLKISENLQKLIFGDVEVPILVNYRSIFQYWQPHPPCLVPMFLDNGESYQGVLHHFFCNRKDTIIKWSFETDYFSEIARNENQLYTLMALEMIVIEDGLNNKIINFCKQINYDKYSEIDKYSDEYGDNLDNPSGLVYYNEHTPFVYIKDYKNYDGDFPSSLTAINPKQINNSCSFELPERRLNSVEIEEIPIWLHKKEDKKTLFNQYIANNQLKKAWLTLNSSGWLLKDIAQSLEILKSKTDDELFHLIADYWINEWEKISSDDFYKSYIL